MAEKNAALNAASNATLNGRELEWIEANAFDLLRDYAAGKRCYDTIVLDPPAFAKTKRDLGKALGGYKELNLRAMKMLRPGGTLVYLLLLVSRQRRRVPGSVSRGSPGRPQIVARGRAARCGERPSSFAECT